MIAYASNTRSVRNLAALRGAGWRILISPTDHVGRVNSRRRIQLCEEAGADSFDGSSASRYSVNVAKLEDSRRQPRLFSARVG